MQWLYLDSVSMCRYTALYVRLWALVTAIEAVDGCSRHEAEEAYARHDGSTDD